MHTAIILSAGRGSRLKPLTNKTPKPLLCIHHKPLIEYHIESLVKSGFQRIVINHAYLGGLIRQRIGHGSRWGIEIVYSPEPPGGLETGGGIVHALPLIGHEPFLAVNADIYTTHAFNKLSLSSNQLAHLVLVNKPIEKLFGDFGLKDGQVSNQNRTFTFAGIAYYHPEFFKGLKPGRFSVTPILRKQADASLVSGELFTGVWDDLGTLSALKRIQDKT